MDPNSSDHVVAMTQLKETIASLQKKINQKDKDLLEKDKMVSGPGHLIIINVEIIKRPPLALDHRIESQEL